MSHLPPHAEKSLRVQDKPFYKINSGGWKRRDRRGVSGRQRGARAGWGRAGTVAEPGAAGRGRKWLLWE